MLQESALKIHRMGNAGNWCVRIADAGNDQGAEIEDAANQALAELKTFELAQVQLDRVSADEAELCNDSPVGEDKFSAPIPQAGKGPKDQGGFLRARE
jgi:hypothetical protein